MGTHLHFQYSATQTTCDICIFRYVAWVQTKTSDLYGQIITYIVKHFYCFTVGSDYSKTLYGKITDIVKGGDGCFTISVMSLYIHYMGHVSVVVTRKKRT